MDIQSVRLRGFIGIKKGMGLDEISLDFSGVNGLLAFSGPTGVGKTTLMENLQPYPVLASRPGKAVKNHVFLRDSIKELAFNHDGARYETLVKIDSESGRTEGFVTVDGEPQIDGKISEYSTFMQQRFGSPDLFFNSVFCAQNSVKISGLRPAELKALFAEFLGDRIAKLIENENTAKQCGNVLAIRMAETDKAIARLKENTVDKLSIQMTLETNRDQLNESEITLSGLQNSLETHQKDLESQKKAQVENEKLELKIETLVPEAARISSEITDLEKQAKSERDELAEKYKDYANRIKNLDELLSLKESIEGAATRKDAIEKTAAELAVKIDGVRTKNENLSRDIAGKEKELSAIEKAIYEITSKIALLDADPKVKKLESQIAVASERIKDLKKVGTDLHCPECAEIQEREIAVVFDCNSTNCEFITKARDAERLLPGLEKELETITAENQAKTAILIKERNEIRTKAATMDENTNALRAEFTAGSKRIKAYTQERSTLLGEIESLGAMAARLPEIQTAQFQKNELESSKEDIKNKGIESRDQWETRISVKRSHLKKIRDEIDEIKAKVDESITDKVEMVESAITIVTKEIKTTEASIAEFNAEITRIKTELAKIENDEKEIARLETERTRLVSELTDWSYLKDACGANGLRSLEIDAVAPSITHDANRLLEQAFGAWAMVDFRTQDEETGKEVLEPRVIDQDGDSVLIGNRSGGQQVWALKALRLAMTMISKEKSGRDFLTAYADEDDAGLDVETAQSFTRLYKAFMDIGGFNKCFYITHKAECVALADHILKFSKGGVRLI